MKKPEVVKLSSPKKVQLEETKKEPIKVTKKKKGVCYVEPCDWLKTSSDRKPRKRYWVGQLFEGIVGCKENVKYWDEGNNEYDKNLNLLSTN